MEECMNVLREQLYIVMDKKDWSATRLSVECGISYSQISKILCGKKKSINLSTLVAIADGVKMPVASLISKEKSKEDEAEEALRNTCISLIDSLQKLKCFKTGN